MAERIGRSGGGREAAEFTADLTPIPKGTFAFGVVKIAESLGIIPFQANGKGGPRYFEESCLLPTQVPIMTYIDGEKETVNTEAVAGNLTGAYQYDEAKRMSAEFQVRVMDLITGRSRASQVHWTRTTKSGNPRGPGGSALKKKNKRHFPTYA